MSAGMVRSEERRVRPPAGPYTTASHCGKLGTLTLPQQIERPRVTCRVKGGERRAHTPATPLPSGRLFRHILSIAPLRSAAVRARMRAPGVDECWDGKIGRAACTPAGWPLYHGFTLRQVGDAHFATAN